MKTIHQETVIQEIKRLCMEANYHLPNDIQDALNDAACHEVNPLAKQTLDVLKENSVIASQTCSPICQDTGMACVFVEIGQDVHIDGSLEAAIT